MTVNEIGKQCMQDRAMGLIQAKRSEQTKAER